MSDLQILLSGPRRRLPSRWLRALPLVVCAIAACKSVPPFSVAHVDRSVATGSKFPVAVDPARVGTFPGRTKSGAGYFYDEVLEYRVWLHPEHGARRLAGNADYFAAFAQYETALEYSTHTSGAEQPLVLIRQRESVDEPSPGTFVWVKTERTTEWQVEWLAGSRRGPDSIADFLAKQSAK
jgi:hypothetical protein